MDDRRGAARPGSNEDRRPPPDPHAIPAGIPGPADRPAGSIPPAGTEEPGFGLPPFDDTGSLVPDPLNDAPEYVPPAVGMLPGAVVAPIEPGQVPTSAWITTAPPRRGRSFLSTLATIGAVVIGLAVIAAIVGLNLRFFQPRGQVLFGTSLGSDLCSVGGETRTLTTTDPVYFAAVLKNRLGGDQSIRLTVTRNAEPFFENVDPANGTEFECYGSRESVGPLEAGVYVFEVTHGGEIEASGTLTVT